ncbi:D-Ala-D-Ala carboxypeptidase family metallohydrolase [Hyalangium versicolor]|uniref:D-Ala-D-Ala carboxypeptidase family metallohydrolase n=1 Tax=Hyalangium versicolor TaxID=2861190 RepID=UPI001CCA74E1|nr:D-Ala-D-Ala carboxypeptidase family metallohydrolase [Hyalangium versicolor]
MALEITEAFVKGTGQAAPRTSFLSPEEKITVRARLINAPDGTEDRIRWTVRPVGPHTGPAVPATFVGKELSFQGSSSNGRAGSRQPNPPLEYEVIASAKVEGQTLEARLPPTSFIRQDEPDIVRQEYADYGTSFQPRLAQISMPRRAILNTGNYAFIVEEDEGKLEELLAQVEQEANRILNDDVQEQKVKTRGLRPDTVVVSPGPSVLEVGPLGDTEPQGDDVCGGPRVKGACAGPILAGRNGIAETTANNRKVRVDLSQLVTSAYRNPQRNRAVGSKSPDSRHTRGRALDLDPRALTVPGKDSRQLMCVLEAAGDRIVGSGNSFTERGSATFLDCNDVAADHVHIQR